MALMLELLFNEETIDYEKRDEDISEMKSKMRNKFQKMFSRRTLVE